MASPAQIAANRVNALKSTGPSSVEGKAATRFNAWKHGADSASQIIPGENPETLAELTGEYYAQFRPAGPMEIALVDAIIQADWNQRRFARIETQVLNALISAQEPCDHPLGAAYTADAAGAGALQKIFRRQQAAQRDWYKARAELARLQAERATTATVTTAAPVPVTVPVPIPAVTAATAPIQKGSGWVGSEPPEWRL
jgi:hypothetical protein